MKRGLPQFAAARGLLVAMLASGTAFAQKQGGVLRV
jgi:hypothetical protein